MSDDRRPLVTFALFTYNQASTVREAALAALAQDYAPIEFIFSDDGSTDETFEIMRATVAGHTRSEHAQLQRNSANLGIAAHVSKVLRQANGRLVILAAGDDLSEPTRTAALVDAWLRHGGGTMYLSSDACIMDPQGQIVGQSVQLGRVPDSIEKLINGEAMPLGATEACTPDLITLFDDLPSNVRNEDWLLPFRAGLAGRMVYLPEALVRHRFSPNSVSKNQTDSSAGEALLKKALYHSGLSNALRAMIQDLDRATRETLTAASKPEIARLHGLIRKRLRELQFIEQLYRARASRSAGELMQLALHHPVRLAVAGLNYFSGRLARMQRPATLPGLEN